jgi:NTP pyrophosphatase (non-canonical NTP hydrolase)
MNELKEFQKEVGEWGDKTFNSKRQFNIESCTYGIVNHLKKEIKEFEDLYELSKLAGNKYLRHSNDDSKETYLQREIADCFILLLHLAHLWNCDLLDEARKKMDINRRREWGDPDQDGVVEHVDKKEKWTNLGWCSAKEHRKIMEGE